MSEHQLGRVHLSGGENELEIVEHDDEDDDFSDHDNQVLTAPVRRDHHPGGGGAARNAPPSREKNSSFGSTSSRFRRTSSRPAAGSLSANLWQARAEGGVVDQSVNLMDTNKMLVDSEVGTSRMARARAGMVSMRQKSMVDVFLADDHPQTRGSASADRGVNDYSSANGRAKKCRPVLLLALVLVIVVVLLVTLPPSFGLVPGMTASDDSGTSPAPTPAPTQEEVLIEEQVQLDRPKPEFLIPIPPDDDTLALQDVPQGGRLEALKFYLMDQDVTEDDQFDDTHKDGPAQKALQWIAQTDPAQMEIPGLEPVAVSNLQAEHAMLQRYALAVFYYSMQAVSSTTQAGNAGRSLQAADEEALANRKTFDDGWLTAEPICSWHGIVCDEDYESVTKIELSNHLLQGTIPRELLAGGSMPYLQTLDLHGNQLRGTLPVVTQERENAGSKLGVPLPPSALEILELVDNLLTGSLDNLMGLSNLVKLNASNNKFTGPIPDGIVDLSRLEDLSLSDNLLTGAIPAESLGELTGLKYLTLVGNNFTGDLPLTLYALTNLKELRLSDNLFNGQIPEEYGDLSNLQVLHLDGNEIKGTVPTQLGQLTNLKELQLDGNDLTGDMPPQICDLRGGILIRLQTDCAKGGIACECCSECF